MNRWAATKLKPRKLRSYPTLVTHVVTKAPGEKYLGILPACLGNPKQYPGIRYFLKAGTISAQAHHAWGATVRGGDFLRWTYRERKKRLDGFRADHNRYHTRPLKTKRGPVYLSSRECSYYYSTAFLHLLRVPAPPTP